MANNQGSLELKENPYYTDKDTNIQEIVENGDYFPFDKIDSEAASSVVEEQPYATVNQNEDKIQPEKWDTRVEYLFNVIGYVVGLGKIWKFPHLCFQYGPGFLFCYTFCYIFIGFPLFVFDVYMGQFTSRGCIQCWSKCRILKALGVGMVACTVLVLFPYTMIIAYAFKYLVLSFYNTLPWSPLLWNNSIGKTSGQQFYEQGGTGIGQSTGLDNFGTPIGDLVGALIFTWALLFGCVCKGLTYSGKIVYLTVGFPYFVIIAVIFHVTTLPGALQGLNDYMFPRNIAQTLADRAAWYGAASQTIFSLSLLQGGLPCLSSFHRFESNLIVNSLIVVLTDYCTSIMCGVIVFSYLGFLKYGKMVNLSGILEKTETLFIAIPQAIAMENDVQQPWAVLFFLLLITLATDTVIAFLRILALAITEIFPKLDYRKYRFYLFLGICIFGIVVSLPLTCPGGLFLQSLVTKFGTDWPLLINSLFVILLAVHLYGGLNITTDIECMIQASKKTSKCWKWLKWYVLFCWYVAAPVMLLIFLICSWYDYATSTWTYYGYPFSDGYHVLAWFIAMSTTISVIVTFFVYFGYAKGSVIERLKFMLNEDPASPIWKPALSKDYAATLNRKNAKREKIIKQRNTI